MNLTIAILVELIDGDDVDGRFDLVLRDALLGEKFLKILIFFRKKNQRETRLERGVLHLLLVHLFGEMRALGVGDALEIQILFIFSQFSGTNVLLNSLLGDRDNLMARSIAHYA